MEREEIEEKLTIIFRKVFRDSELVLNDEMTTNDIEAWDSLSHVMMVSEVQKEFGIKFKLFELNNLTKVGNLINSIETKV